jgi:hypothetical protein
VPLLLLVLLLDALLPGLLAEPLLDVLDGDRRSVVVEQDALLLGDLVVPALEMMSGPRASSCGTRASPMARLAARSEPSRTTMTVCALAVRASTRCSSRTLGCVGGRRASYCVRSSSFEAKYPKTTVTRATAISGNQGRRTCRSLSRSMNRVTTRGCL